MAGFVAFGRVCDGVAMAWIELDGAVNVRDLGDLPTEDGQKTARARLLRADNLQDLSAADIRKLVRDIGVTTVVDLRSSNELAAEGPAPLDMMASVRSPVAGVPAWAVTGDYAATGERTEAIMARLRRSRLYSRDVNSKPAQLHQPRAETMTAFLEQMDARFGGVASWLTDHGLSAADLAALRLKLRAPTTTLPR